jgi:hypothetical protein
MSIRLDNIRKSNNHDLIMDSLIAGVNVLIRILKRTFCEQVGQRYASLEANHYLPMVKVEGYPAFLHEALK